MPDKVSSPSHRHMLKYDKYKIHMKRANAKVRLPRPLTYEGRGNIPVVADEARGRTLGMEQGLI